MAGKVVIVAHGAAAVRERFAAALDASGHRVVVVAGADGLHEAIAGARDELALVLLEASAAPAAPVTGAPVVVFAGSVGDAAAARAWAAAGVRGWVNEHAAPHVILSSLAPLLFHDRFDRRATPRVPVAMTVSCTAGGSVSAATALNIGGGGLALRPLAPVPVGEAVRLRFRLPAVSGDLEAEARVCWSDVRYGLGVQFEAGDEHALAAIEAFVERHVPRA